MAAPPPRILIVDADGASAQRMGLALDGSGFEVVWCSFAPSELAGVLTELKPTLLLVHAELASPQLATLIARLESASMAGLPLVLLCRDDGDEVFTRNMKAGVVAMLAEPFSPRVHLARLRTLLTQLPRRTGALRGAGGPNELGALVHHLMRTRRTGGITVGEHQDARAFFVRGVLKSARYQTQTMQAALAAMTRTHAPWTFVEGVEGNAGVIDLDPGSGEAPPRSTEAPLVPAAARLDPNRVALDGDRFGEQSPPTRTPEPAPQVLDPEAAHTTLLFVDDDPAVVQLLSTYFSKRGYGVVTAVDGLDAMARLVAQSFDAVIADLNMPRLDGWGLLRLVREDLRTHEVPVALFSAQDNYRESLRLLHAGAQAYFSKTLRLSALEVQVKELLEPRRRFVRLISSDGGLEFDFSVLGQQWVCRALCQAAFSGQLDARNAWGAWLLFFDAGRLVQATAKVGASLLSGDRALSAFLTARGAQGSLRSGTRTQDEGFSGESVQRTLERLVPWLNDEQRRAREGELARAQALTVDEELYRLYLRVGPPAWLPIARLLCEAKLQPVEVIERLQVTPTEVAAVVKDLLRRGVTSLQ